MKQVIAAFYGRNPDFSYFVGGSTGGQQALQEAQRYPDDYDAILAAIPAHCRTPLHAYFLWNEQILNACKFTDFQQANILEAANEIAVPEEPPVTAGRIVSDPRCTEERIEAVIRRAREKDNTLTEAHVAALRKLFSGPRHAVTGEHIFDGIPIGSSFATAQGNLYLFKWVFGADTDPMKLNFAGDMDAYTAALGPQLNADNSDLEAFARRGGKLLIYSGTADSVVPYHATLDYYERVAERFGGIENVQTFCRYYLIPGMGHGPGEKPTSPGVNALPDMLELLVRWRESDEAPEQIEGKRMTNGQTDWTMPIHPYPAKTGWDAAAGGFTKMEGPRGGVGRVADRFRP